MAIQYSLSTLVNMTFNSDGTRAQLVAQLAAALTTAGWSTISGGGTSDILMKTAVTPTGLSVCFRLFDPGANNCAQFTLRNQAGSSAAQIIYMLPTNGKTFRIIANKYQFFFFSTGSANAATAREVLMGGVPYVPSFLAATLSNFENGWMTGTGNTDIAAAASQSFRTLLYGSENNYGYSSWLWNGTLTNSVGNGIMAMICAPSGWQTASGFVWHDASIPMDDALLAYPLAPGSNSTVDLRGQVWDAVAMPAPFASEALYAVDGGSFMTITENNSRGTLLVKVA